MDVIGMVSLVAVLRNIGAGSNVLSLPPLSGEMRYAPSPETPLFLIDIL